MCDKTCFRPVDPPRSAIELLKEAERRKAERERKKQSPGSEFIEDNFR